MTRRVWVGIGLALAAGLAVILAACGPLLYPPRPPVPPQLRGISGFSAPYARGLGGAWSVPAYYVPPTRATGGGQVLTAPCIVYLHEAWPTAGTANIDWSDYDACVAAAQAQTITLPDGITHTQGIILDVPAGFLDPNGTGTLADPYNAPYLASWMANTSYRQIVTSTTGTHYYALTYGGAFGSAMADFVTAAGARFNTTANLQAVRLYLGAQGETQQTKPGGSDSASVAQAAVETVTGCWAYYNWILDMGRAASTAFPNIPVVIMAGTDPGSCASGSTLRRAIVALAAEGYPVGVSVNSGAPRWANAQGYSAPNCTADVYAVGADLAAVGSPFIMEYGLNPDLAASCTGAADCQSYMVYTLLAARHWQADWNLYHPTWNAYTTTLLWQYNDALFNADDTALIAFRDIEYPAWEWRAGCGTSDTRGDFEAYLTNLSSSGVNQACRADVQAAAQAYAAGIMSANSVYRMVTPCPLTLPTPAATSDELNRVANRQARRLAAGETLSLAYAATWSYYGANQVVTATLDYLDIGSETLRVQLFGAPAWAITRTGTGLWLAASISTTATISNGLSAGAGITITNDGATATYLHVLRVDANTAAQGAPITPTPQPTATPTATMAPFQLRNYLGNDYIATPPTLDGDTAEWDGLGLTPKQVTIINSNYVSNISGDGDLRATVWSARDEGYLYLGARVSDNAVYTDSLAYYDDDMLRFGIVTNQAGTGTPWTVGVIAGSNSITATNLVSATVASAVITGTGTYTIGYEIRIPWSSLGGVKLPASGEWRVYLAIQDDDDGGAVDGKLAPWTGVGAASSADTFEPRWGRLLADGAAYPTATPAPTPTGVPTPTRWPGAYLDSPMDTAPIENWTSYGPQGGGSITTITTGCVTANCWLWQYNYYNPTWLYMRWDVSNPYGFSYTNTAGSLHIAFDIKMIATPTVIEQILYGYSDASPNGPLLQYYPRAVGTPNAWKWTTQGGLGASFVWDAPDNTWMHLDVYADQQGSGYHDGTATVEPGELAYRLSVNGTPQPTPTIQNTNYGVPALEFLAPLGLSRWYMGPVLSPSGIFTHTTDNLVIEHMVCAAGTCPSPTPLATATPTPTPQNTPSPTPTFTPAPLVLEVFSRQASPCVWDYNERGGCNQGDEFVELYAPFAQSLAGVTLVITPCEQVLPADTLILAAGRLVLWADAMRDATTLTVCAGLPVSGTVALQDVAGNLVDLLDYPDAGAGYSWACGTDGLCGVATPSPGR